MRGRLLAVRAVRHVLVDRYLRGRTGLVAHPAWRRLMATSLSARFTKYVSIVVLVTTSSATGWTNAHLRRLAHDDGLRLAIVTGAYVAVTIVLFLGKFLLYEYWVFSDRSRVRAALRSLRQVVKIARANRSP